MTTRSVANHDEPSSLDVENVFKLTFETAVGLVVMTLAAHGRPLVSVVNRHPAERFAQLLTGCNILICKLVEERLELVLRRQQACMLFWTSHLLIRFIIAAEVVLVRFVTFKNHVAQLNFCFLVFTVSVLHFCQS